VYGYLAGYGGTPPAVVAFEFIFPVGNCLTITVDPVKIILRTKKNIGTLDTQDIRRTDILYPEIDVRTVIADLDYLYPALQAVT
jgi:hypothetical protein